MTAATRDSAPARQPTVHAAAIFLSAFLLFLVQPLIAKQILPWFGGAASVWTTCLVFFQTSLLLGYAYSDFVARRLALSTQVKLHAGLLLLSLVSLPIIPAVRWRPTGSEDPPLLILAVLATTIGIPYVLLSATSPIVQSWLAGTRPGSSPYRLFALSNLASLLALVSYPFLLEPWVRTRWQALAWSGAYGVFVVLCIAAGWLSARRLRETENSDISTSPESATAGAAAAAGPGASTETQPVNGTGATGELRGVRRSGREGRAAGAERSGSTDPSGRASGGAPGRYSRKERRRAGGTSSTGAAFEPDTAAPPTAASQALWAMLAALGVFLLLAITNRITQDIASIPLFWIVPLALYLATFIICFDHPRWYRRGPIVVLLAVMLVAMGVGLVSPAVEYRYRLQIAVFAVGLFVACMFCHGELVRSRPAPAFLTRFYLMIAIGGAAGSVLVGIVAPLVLPAYFELGFGLVATGALLFWQTKGDALSLRAFAALATIAVVGFTGWSIRAFYDGTVTASRNFYGVLRVMEGGAGQYYYRTLVHGGVRHGTQYLNLPPYPTNYYVPTSGVGRWLLPRPETPIRVGLIGMGVGTLAIYGVPGDTMRFYEIDPDVVRLATRDFTFLSGSRATLETVLGDARLSLEREPPQRFDLLVVDAFFSDAIPTHLLTLEAMEVYRRHLKPGGVIAFHLTNRFLNLVPVVAALAEASQLTAVHVRDETMEEPAVSNDWVLLSDSAESLNRPRVAELATSLEGSMDPRRAWTDDFNNLLSALR